MKNEISLNKVALANRETLYYRECGSGNRTLILIHGNMTSSKHWDVLLENFPSGYKIYAIDLRGFGLSTYYSSISSMKDFSEDIKLFVDKLNLKNFSIMGWSLGSAVAMQFTIDHSEYVDKLILLSPVSVKGYNKYKLNSPNTLIYDIMLYSKKEVERYLSFLLDSYGSTKRMYFKFLWDNLVYDQNQPSPEKYEEYLDDMLTQRNIIDVKYALTSFNISHESNGVVDGNGYVDKILVPTLVIHGDRDKVIPPEAAAENVLEIGCNARLKILDNCGHSPLIDSLQELIELVVEFLNE